MIGVVQGRSGTGGCTEVFMVHSATTVVVFDVEVSTHRWKRIMEERTRESRMERRNNKPKREMRRVLHDSIHNRNDFLKSYCLICGFLQMFFTDERTCGRTYRPSFSDARTYLKSKMKTMNNKNEIPAMRFTINRRFPIGGSA